jgi:hypothetical protein
MLLPLIIDDPLFPRSAVDKQAAAPISQRVIAFQSRSYMLASEQTNFF